MNSDLINHKDRESLARLITIIFIFFLHNNNYEAENVSSNIMDLDIT